MLYQGLERERLEGAALWPPARGAGAGPGPRAVLFLGIGRQSHAPYCSARPGAPTKPAPSILASPRLASESAAALSASPLFAFPRRVSLQDYLDKLHDAVFHHHLPRHVAGCDRDGWRPRLQAAFLAPRKKPSPRGERKAAAIVDITEPPRAPPLHAARRGSAGACSTLPV